jgi:farnesyl diphosphate synthase
MPLSGTPTFDAALAHTVRSVEQTMDRLLPSGDGPESKLYAAMRYVALGHGKRIRPFFVLAGATLFGVSPKAALRAAAAVELVHCYSLAYDDLPALDNDELRRGRPSCHRQFDEATAILAGDALQALAFEVLAHTDTHGDPAVRCTLIAGLAQAIGAHGMVGGQMIDLEVEGQDLQSAAIIRLQRLKTGTLLAFACTAGAVLGKASDSLRHALHAYAHDIGLAFQITDDLLDAEGTRQDTGKTPGKDVAAEKANFVRVLGLERARDQALLLARQATQHLDPFGRKADLLRQAATFVVERRS